MAGKRGPTWAQVLLVGIVLTWIGVGAARATVLREPARGPSGTPLPRALRGGGWHPFDARGGADFWKLLTALPARVPEQDADQLLVHVPSAQVDDPRLAGPGLRDTNGDVRCYPYEDRYFPYFSYRGYAYPYYYYAYPTYYSCYYRPVGDGYRATFFYVHAPAYYPGYYYYYDYQADGDELLAFRATH